MPSALQSLSTSRLADEKNLAEKTNFGPWFYGRAKIAQKNYE